MIKRTVRHCIFALLTFSLIFSLSTVSFAAIAVDQNHGDHKFVEKITKGNLFMSDAEIEKYCSICDKFGGRTQYDSDWKFRFLGYKKEEGISAGYNDWMSQAYLEAWYPDYEYTGKPICPEFYLETQRNYYPIPVPKEWYTVTYKNNIEPGVGSVIIKVKTKFFEEEEIEYRFRIVSSVKVKKTSIKTAVGGKKRISLSWKKQKNVSGYEIQLSTKKTFASAKTIVVKKAKTTKKTIKKLKANKKYYVRIRSFRKKNGIKYYSEWSKTKRVKTKK